jgi:hypothetical protein
VADAQPGFAVFEGSFLENRYLQHFDPPLNARGGN